MLERPRRVARLGVPVCLAALLWPGAARATDFEVEGQTALQGYEVASPWGDVILERRRLMQTVGFGVYNLQGAYRPGQAEYSIVLKLRLNGDFGINNHLEGSQAGGETSFAGDSGRLAGERYVPGLDPYPLDLMYGYVEGRNLAGGWLGFRAGRQYMTDMLGWWSFDGGLVRVTTPFYVQAEFYGGLEQRGGLPLSTGRFERQGVWRGSHGAFGGTGEPEVVDYPSYLYAEPAPAFGVALETNGPSFVHGRFDYRRVYNTGKVLTQQFPDPTGGYRTVRGLRVSQDRLGYAADINKSDLGGLKAGFSYDLYSQIIGTLYAGLEAYLGHKVTVGADLDYFVPTFDADSIWNWFTRSPVTTILGRASVDVTSRFDIAASGGIRMWKADGDPDTFGQGQCKAFGGITPADCLNGSKFFDASGNAEVRKFSRDEANRSLSTTTDVLANLGGRYRFNTANLGLRGMLETGDRGRRTGADVTGEKQLDGGRYTLGSRVSFYNWRDPLRPGRGANSFAYVLGGGYKPAELADVRIEWEHDINRLVGQRFRIVALLNLWWGTK